jgi:hypothetical protein
VRCKIVSKLILQILNKIAKSLEKMLVIQSERKVLQLSSK